ncbi:hypothetical protein ACFSTC_14620 [Nonomuraea ferruginea]
MSIRTPAHRENGSRVDHHADHFGLARPVPPVRTARHRAEPRWSPAH